MDIRFKNNVPYVEDQNILELTKLVPTPFYLYSQQKIMDTYLELKKTIKKEIYYSVKANSNQAIIKIFNSLGCGFDVVSIEELKRVLNINVSPSKIIFEGVGKSTDDIKYAINKNIRQINVESIEELILINQLAKNLNQVPSLGIRINPDIDSKSIKKISTGKKTDKFGIDFNKIGDVCNIIKTLQHIKVIGISCHIGSQIFEIEVFESVINKMKKALNIFHENNISINNVDLGGGFGFDYNYEISQKKLDINKLSLLVENNFNNSEIEISFEPGRYLVAGSGIIVTKILTTKKNGDINFLITDAGMQTFLRPALYNSHHKLLSLNENKEEDIYTVAGPICESSDILASNIQLPKQEIGDFLIICDAGAYGSVMASNYNSKSLPAEILVFDNQFEIIRKKQNIEDLINADVLPGWLNN